MVSQSSLTEFDSATFRRALGRFPTGVAIITGCWRDQLVGITVSSFNSVSLDPPLVLFSVARTSRALPILKQVERFAINLLDESKQDLSRRFATARADKWVGVGSCIDSGAPVLDDAMAAFVCDRYNAYDGGDHEIFIGRVNEIIERSDDAPLVFYGGAYHRLAPGDHGRGGRTTSA